MVLTDIAIVLVAACTAGIAVFLFAARNAPKRQVEFGELSAVSFARVFLFDGQTLLEATPAAEEMLRGGSRELAHWPRLLSMLGRSFPSIDDPLNTLSETGHFRKRSEDGRWALEAEWIDGVTRIVLQPQNGDQDTEEPAALAPMVDELETLREVVNDLPVLTWREDANGDIVWANAAYLEMVARSKEGDGPVQWPLPRLFDARFGTGTTAEATKRVSTRAPGDAEIHWYECITHQSNNQCLVFALPANRLVKAEASLREFIQTLTQTFAHLPAGIAIFDKNRRLALFNPALTDLSTLEVDFLSSRPTLYAFLDRLREKRRMPEPKDYKSWRQQISDLEQAATNGTHQENWSLPTGQTFAVTGRPHPGGAVAFLFEDISAEIGLTRQYRSELELGQTVVDALDAAIAVFSPGGTLVQSNRRYQELWDQDPTAAFGELSILEATRNWQDRTEPNPAWGEARNFVTQPHDREEWSAEATLLDGRTLTARFVPIGGGSTLIMFEEAVIPAPATAQRAHVLTA